MEMCEGGSLEKLMKNNKQVDGFKEKHAKDILLQIALGVKALHSIGITHRDLKPDNIYINDKYVKIGDLGFSSNADFLKT
jgi:serine/threonine protein kinase